MSPLEIAANSLGGWAESLSPLEIAAVLLGTANIILLVRRNILNYPFGMAMVLLYVVIDYRSRLYGEMGLQVFFFVVQGYGWWLWARAGGVEHQVDVRWLGWKARIACLAAIGIFALLVGTFMHRLTDAAMPFADATLAGASIVAQFLLSFRRIENWVLWIAIDLGSVPLFYSRGLHLTAVLYAAFLVLSIIGLREWTRAYRGKPA